MNTPSKQLASLAAACIVGGVIVYFAVGTPVGTRLPEPFRGEFVSTNTPGSESTSGQAEHADGMSDEMYSAIRDRVREAIARTAVPNPEAVSHVATEYAAFVADLDIDRLLALAMDANAVPHPPTVAQFRVMLASFPERRQPPGWRAFNDLQVLRWGFDVSRSARWESVVLDTISARYFPAGPETEEFAAVWQMNAPEGYEYSGDSPAAIGIPDFYSRVRRGEVASLLVSFAVRNKRGDHLLLTLHLAEYEPGKWYPLEYRTDAAKSASLFDAERAPRPK